jgi:hypothetical protein
MLPDIVLPDIVLPDIVLNDTKLGAAAAAPSSIGVRISPGLKVTAA